MIFVINFFVFMKHYKIVKNREEFIILKSFVFKRITVIIELIDFYDVFSIGNQQLCHVEECLSNLCHYCNFTLYFMVENCLIILPCFYSGRFDVCILLFSL